MPPITLWRSASAAALLFAVSHAAPAAVLGGQLLFAETDPDNGTELWVSDGTEAGTLLLKDIAVGIDDDDDPLSSAPEELTTFQDRVFFAADDGENGRELWVSDGTAAGTVLFLDIAEGDDTDDEPAGSNPADFTIVGSRLFFAASDGVDGRELWTTDGTVEGTRMVKDIAEGSLASIGFAPGLTAFDGNVYFAAQDATHGYELWKSNGTVDGTQLVRDIIPDAGVGSSPLRLTVVGDTLYFAAFTLTSGYELWKTDGTADGTVMVGDINAGAEGSNPTGLVEVGGALYFAANDGTLGVELWRADDNGASLVKDIAVDDDADDGEDVSSAPSLLTNLGGTLVFTAADADHGRELWASDGTAAGTVLLGDIREGATDGAISELLVVDDTLFFRANDDTNGSELWKTDGTAAGTALVFDVDPGSDDSAPKRLEAIGDLLFFFANEGSSSIELWTHDLAAGTTQLVRNIERGTTSTGGGGGGGGGGPVAPALLTGLLLGAALRRTRNRRI